VAAAHGQWAAFNDHIRGPGTASNATDYCVYGFTNNPATGSPGPDAGPLRAILTGSNLPVTLTVTNFSLPYGGSSSGAPNAGTPAHSVFNGCVHFGTGGNLWHAPILDNDAVVAHVFSGLTPGTEYRFTATAVRGGYYLDRWTLATLVGPTRFVAAHTPGVLTSNEVPALGPHQAAINGGHNLAGDLVVWDRIVAPAHGVVAVLQTHYRGEVPGGSSAGTSTYAFQAIKFEAQFEPAVIMTPPQPASACPGGPALFTVEATGTGLVYQWRKDDVDIPSATNATLVIASAGPADAGLYSVVVSNALNVVTSAPAALTIANEPIRLLAGGPANVVVGAGSNAVFAVALEAGSQPLAVQWFANTASNNLTGTPLPGETNLSLTVTGVGPATAPYYYAVLSNCVGEARSRVALLSVWLLPIEITLEPQDASEVVGGSVTLSVTATGSGLRYQWYRSGQPLAGAGATHRTLVLTNLQYADSGPYHVVVFNDYTSVRSRDAVVAVKPAPYLLYGLTNQVWRYDQSGTDPGAAWRGVDYPAEAGWPEGRGVLGYDNNLGIVPLTNTVLALTAGGATIRAYYFRTTFVLTNEPAEVVLVTSNLIDDGAVFYLNGVEVARTANMPTGPINYRSLATSPGTENTYFTLVIPGSLLVPGTNLMAVEVHQNSDTSTDIVFGQAAFVAFVTPTSLAITNQPAPAVVEETRAATFTVGHSGGPARYQWHRWTSQGAVAITNNPTARQSTLVLSNLVAGEDDGFYCVTLSNVLSFLVSSNAQLVVAVDTNAPALLRADGAQSASNVVLTFGEAVAPGAPPHSLADPANYTVTNTHGGSAAILEAVFLPPDRVRLTTTPRAAGSNWVVTVRSLTDASPRANTAANVAAAISTVLTLVPLGERNYRFIQPIFGFDPNPAATFNTNRWTRLDYDENDPNLGGWADGSAAFYLGPWMWYDLLAPQGTPIGQNDQITGVYVRKAFDFTGSPAGLELSYRYAVADGAVFYLNGVEFDRFQMPPGQPTITTPATAQNGDYSASVWTIPTTDYLALPASLLSVGPNLFAAEFHGVTPNETAQAFAAELRARVDSFVVGPVIITRGPASLTVIENTPARLTHASVGGRSFAWQSNGVAIAGATGPEYVMPRTPLSANGARFSVTVTGLEDSQISAEATLTVLPDTTPPALRGAWYLGPNLLSLEFSEPVHPADALNRAYYRMTNALDGGASMPIAGITLAHGTNALITFGTPLAPGQWTVVVSHIRDEAATPNRIAANSPVTVGLRGYPLIVMDTNSLWRFHEGGADLGSAWRGVNYDDSGWATGGQVFDGWTSEFRTMLGDMPVGTRLNSIDLDVNPPTLYFRKRVVIPVIGPGASLAIRHLVDDGMALYANRNLCYAIGVTTPTTYSAWASRTIGTAALEGPFPADASSLVAGDNVFAVELKNVTSTSADITLGVDLWLDVPSQVLPPGGPDEPPLVESPTLFIERAANEQVTLWWTNAGAFTLETVTNLEAGGWSPVPDPGNPWTTPATNAPRFFRLRQ